MTDLAIKPDKWSQFSDRQLVDLCCRESNGLPTQYLGMPKPELVSLIEQFTSGRGNALA